MEDYKFLFKVVLVGNAGVGKTCLVRRFTQGMFPPGQGATIGVDFMIKTVEIDGEKIKVCNCNYLFIFSPHSRVVFFSSRGRNTTELNLLLPSVSSVRRRVIIFYVENKCFTVVCINIGSYFQR